MREQREHGRGAAIWIRRSCFKLMIACAAVVMVAAAATESRAADPVKPVAGKQVRFPEGYWSALPQIGPEGKVRQCVLVARRSRSGRGGAIGTDLSLTIGRGAGLAISILDREVPSEQVLDDQAEILLDGSRSFPAAGFTAGSTSFSMHPGDAAGVLSALQKAVTLTLRSDGAGIDTGAMTLDLPREALSWLKRCGETFNIAIDRPTDPAAPALPMPRPRSAEISSAKPTAAGPAGIEDKQKISGWDASELRGSDGTVAACLIRRHYAEVPGADKHRNSIFLMVSRAKGLFMMLKDSDLNLPEGQRIEATLSIGGKPFPDFSAHVLGNDEIGLFPQHGSALALAFEHGDEFDFKTPVIRFEGGVTSGVVPWLRACARRHGFGVEQLSQAGVQALYQGGFEARVAGNYVRAIRLLSDAIATGKLNDGDRATSYNNRGMAFAAKGEDEKAVADYTMAIKIAPAYGPAYLNRGNVYSNQDKLDAAIADYDLAIKISPSYELAYNSRGAAYYKKDELDTALADLSTAIRLKPDYANAYWNRARVYSHRGDYDNALADFGEAIRFKPKEAEIYAERGDLRAAHGDNARAIADYTAAIKLNADTAPFYNNRGNSYFAIGETGKATADFDIAIRLDPGFADPVISRGRIALFHDGRPAAAAEDLASGVHLAPKYANAALWLHIARSRSGTPDREELAANVEKVGPGTWPRPLLDLFLGTATPDSVRRAASDAKDSGTQQEQNCEADFYIGMFKLEKTARDEAREFLTAAADKCPADMLEKAAAMAELARWSS
jgi:tetratricopeptide (TPR) repeat protein